MDTELNADGTKYFFNTFENIESSIQKLDRNIKEPDIISWFTVITNKEDQLRKGNIMPSADPAINSTNFSNKSPGRTSQKKSQSSESEQHSSRQNSATRVMIGTAITRNGMTVKCVMLQ